MLSLTSYTKNQTIVQAGEPFVCFHIITEGSVAAIYDSTETPKSFTLKKGDVIGIFDFSFKEYSFTYKALESTSVITYSLTDFSHLEKLLEEHKELSHFLILSMEVERALTYIIPRLPPFFLFFLQFFSKKRKILKKIYFYLKIN